MRNRMGNAHRQKNIIKDGKISLLLYYFIFINSMYTTGNRLFLQAAIDLNNPELNVRILFNMLYIK